MTKIRSARGEMVDIDIMRIKQQIASGPEPSIVKDRRESIDRKMKRRIKKTVVPGPIVIPVLQPVVLDTPAEEIVELVADTDEIVVQSTPVTKPKRTSK